MGRKWTEQEEKKLLKLYSNTDNKELALLFNKTVCQVYNKAHNMGIKKDKAFLSEWLKMKYQNGEFRNGEKTVFKKGHQTHNKGKKWSDYAPKESQEKMKQTTFKKGNKPHNAYDSEFGVISVRPNDGKEYQFIKMANSKWVAYHRYIWEMNKGPIPKGMSIYFKDGNTMNTNIENLKLVDRNELLQLNRQLIKEKGNNDLRMKKINESRTKNRLEALKNTPVIKSNYAITGKKPLVLDNKTTIYIDANKDPQKVLETYRKRNILSPL